MSLPSRERELKLCRIILELRFSHVAPLAGARIETLIPQSFATATTSLPSRERELKLATKYYPCTRCKSLPSRERELKLRPHGYRTDSQRSLPSRERELKPGSRAINQNVTLSLPSRERELKHPLCQSSLRGEHVAPLAGARIETCMRAAI